MLTLTDFTHIALFFLFQRAKIHGHQIELQQLPSGTWYVVAFEINDMNATDQSFADDEEI